MRTTSAFALAVVALSAASTLAAPLRSQDSVIRRSPTGTTVTQKSKSGSGSASLPTVTRRAKSIQRICAPGEKPGKKPRGKTSPNRQTGAANGAPQPNPIAARSVVSPSPSATTAVQGGSTAPAPTPAPNTGKTKHNKIIATRTTTGRDNKATEVHVLEATTASTCYVPIPTPAYINRKGAKPSPDGGPAPTSQGPPKLATRDADILGRDFSEFDELD